MNDNRFYKLHIFSAGTHKSASGHTCTLTEDDLQSTANVFVSNHRVPLCLGHSSYKKKDILPSMGWFRSVKEENGELYGLLETTPAGKALIDGGYYENFSASFYAPDSPLNPKPGTWTLRHVAALGEEPPALKELDPLLDIIPEDFSEVQDFERFYEFKSADSNDFEEFSDGNTSLLPDTFEFKTFRKFGKTLNCKPGYKQCKGGCIKNSWVCGGKQSKKFAPGTKKDYKKPTQKNTSPAKSNFLPKEEWQKKKDAEKPKSTFVPKEDWQKKKDEEKAEKKKEQTKENLTTGNIKGIAAGLLIVGADVLSESSFPDNKQAKAASKIASSLIANQIVLKNDVDMSSRMKALAYGGLKGGLNFGVQSALQDNPAAKTMASATTAMMEQLLEKSGLVDVDSYDKYAKGLMSATETFGSAIQDVKKFKKYQSEGDKYKEALKNEMAETKAQLDRLLEEPERKSKQQDLRIDRLEESSRRNARSKDMDDVRFGMVDKRIQSLLDLFMTQAKGEMDTEGLLKKLRQIQDEYNNAQIRDYSEAENHKNSDSYGKTGKLYYPNSDVAITFTRAEAMAAIFPFALAIARYLGIIKGKDIKKAYAKPAPSGNPQLDAIFSELKQAKEVIHHDNVENESLFRALFGDNRLVKQEELDGIDRAFSENVGTEQGSVGKRKRRKNRRGNDNFSEGNDKTRKRRKSERILSVDSLISDAISQAESSMGEDFGEAQTENVGRNSRRRSSSGNQRQNRRNIPKKQKATTISFAETKPRQKRVQIQSFSETSNQMDSKESQEVKRLKKELENEKLRARRLEVESFCERLYEKGQLTQGFARKKDLVNFLLKQEQDEGSFDFGEGSSAGHSEYDFVVNMLQNIDPVVSFSEVVEESTMVPMPKFEDGYDMQSQKLDYQINLLMQANPELTYSDAWAKVAGGTLR